MRRLLSLLLFFVGFSNASHAQYSWVNQWYDGALTFNDVFMVNNFEGYAVGTDGVTSQVYKTLNGGNIWAGNWTPPNEQNLVSCHFLTKDHGYVVSTDSDVYETIDGGQNWTPIYDETGAAVAYNIFVAGSRVLVTRNGETLYSDDGTNWFTSSTTFSGVVSGISFYDSQYGVVCGDVGGISYTTDGGTSWGPISAPATYNTTDFYSVHVFNQNEFIIVGVGGAIVKTLTNGGSWIYPAAPSAQNLADVHFVNGSHGVACGANNTIYYSTDGGGTWIDQPAVTSSANFYSVRVTNELTAFVVGGNGEIWVSPDTADIATGDYIGPTTVCAGEPFDFQFVFTNVGNDTAYNESFNAINNTVTIPGFPVSYNGTTYPGETDTITINITLGAGTNSINYWSQNSVNAANNFRDTIIIGVAPQSTSVLGSPLFCPGDTITLVASGGNSYSWLNVAGSDPSNPIQDVYPTQNSTYVVEIDQGVCIVMDSITVTMNPFCDTSVVDTTQFPTPADSYAFSPNYDNVNDILVLDFLDLSAAYNTVTIYNRWGDPVFKTNDYNNSDKAWDGLYNDRISPAGTYFFIAETPYLGVVKGWIQLVR